MSDIESEHVDGGGDGMDTGHDWGPIVRIVLVELALVLLVVAGIGALIRGASAPDPADAAPTVALSELPEATAALYQYAADHADHFVELPCYCGCDRTLGHQNLKDCFVNPTGDWDAHASGCEVCTIEAVAAREQLDSGKPIAEVRQSIIDRYGPPPAA